jgi:hypothetical protein
MPEKKQYIKHVADEVTLMAGGWTGTTDSLPYFGIFSPFGGCNYRVNQLFKCF